MKYILVHTMYALKLDPTGQVYCAIFVFMYVCVYVCMCVHSFAESIHKSNINGGGLH